jgi:hypothetical protein
MLICLIKNGASSAMIAQKLRKAGALPAAFHYKK